MAKQYFESVNPASEQTIGQIAVINDAAIEQILTVAASQSAAWAATPVAERAALLGRIADALDAQRETLAALITREMGKKIAESRAEVEKCAWVCRYYAEHAATFLADEEIASDAARSLVAYQPLGALLAVMPWNFPFWQVFRFAAPALAAGNVGLLKHASNVMGCAQAIEKLIHEAGAPQGVFTSLPIPSDRVAEVVDDPRVAAVTLTGSEPAGRAVAGRAGAALKKSVLELGGSDPFVVLEDADIETAVAKAVQSRFMNAGQSCIAAKRFILVGGAGEAFLSRFVDAVAALRPGDPMDEDTDLAPLARADLRDQLHAQVEDAVGKGASLLTGGQPLERRGYYYAPTVLADIRPGMRAFDEELFGPVAAVYRVADEAEALELANATDFGLGGSVWTAGRERGLAFARRMQCGCAFVNELVKSDPRLPFGGVKSSGYGRELAVLGIREFVNAKSIWVD
jgi:succinate-semialdehyde dehydrogenase/glutarate-semialdehyde dehydrogenase